MFKFAALALAFYITGLLSFTLSAPFPGPVNILAGIVSLILAFVFSAFLLNKSTKPTF